MNENKHTAEQSKQAISDSNAAFHELKAGQAEEYGNLIRQHRIAHSAIKEELGTVKGQREFIEDEMNEAVQAQSDAFVQSVGDQSDPDYIIAADKARRMLGQRLELDQTLSDLNEDLRHPIGEYEKPELLSLEEAMKLYRQIRAEGDEQGDPEGLAEVLDVLHDVDEEEESRREIWRGKRGKSEYGVLRTASDDVLAYIAMFPDRIVTGREIGLEIYNHRSDIVDNPDRRDAAYKAGTLVASLMSKGDGTLAKQAEKLLEEHSLYLQYGKRQFVRDGKILNRAGMNIYRGVSDPNTVSGTIETHNGEVTYRDIMIGVVLLGEKEYDSLSPVHPHKQQQAESRPVDPTPDSPPVPQITTPETKPPVLTTDTESIDTVQPEKEQAWEARLKAELDRVIQQLVKDNLFEEDEMTGGVIRQFSSFDIGTRTAKDKLSNAGIMSKEDARSDMMNREQRVVSALLNTTPELQQARGKNRYKRAREIVTEKIDEYLRQSEQAS